jgi:hypothetical protein
LIPKNTRFSAINKDTTNLVEETDLKGHFEKIVKEHVFEEQNFVKQKALFKQHDFLETPRRKSSLAEVKARLKDNMAIRRIVKKGEREKSNSIFNAK